MITSINDYLKQKESEYRAFDKQRFVIIFNALKPKILKKFAPAKEPKMIHIVGTNGKGSTGRFLSLMIQASQKQVGHFVSPHLFDFCDRFWINGQIVSHNQLLHIHKQLESICDAESVAYIHKMSYFEYATTLAYCLFLGLDYAVIEAGLGGEFDSTTQLTRILSLFTPISLDHEELLGNNIQDIARTKVRSLCAYGIVGYQPFLNEIQEVFKEVIQEKNTNKIPAKLEFLQYFSLSTEEQIYLNSNNLPTYQQYNFALAKAALSYLKLPYHPDRMQKFDLQGRMQKIAENLYVDVGHNPQAAEFAATSVFKDKKFELIYNSYRDKNFKQILRIFKPFVIKIHILIIENNYRILPIDELVAYLKELDIPFEFFSFPLRKESRYLVFGSFSVVEKFLKYYESEKNQ
ncbi:hypothetical protein CCZ01_04575 [Helicobacter monodelphidis]|uniref:bifunctional folylpolyglutamate synthase/dihydrofolate synthase n=1 Tax=Helicobacter sp. 15-1451 TaxID=2004995 RepID=UPI000DCC01C9|nr:bifunctional folylpolyglutamate synthase/dihydrofolate synthase [Helicobacter sp. 15-1451]RAX57909.1 hypothetical protein CCZ01_04575 [Helicobacter sp. 15-1451]